MLILSTALAKEGYDPAVQALSEQQIKEAPKAERYVCCSM
jgi:hypothetical protein